MYLTIVTNAILHFKILFHGEDRASLVTHIDTKSLPSQYGGDMTLATDQGLDLHQLLCVYDERYQSKWLHLYYNFRYSPLCYSHIDTECQPSQYTGLTFDTSHWPEPKHGEGTKLHIKITLPKANVSTVKREGGGCKIQATQLSVFL